MDDAAWTESLAERPLLWAGTYPAGPPTELWTYDGTAWQQVEIPDFDDANNFTICPGTVLDGRLYLSTGNESGGTEIWQYSACDPLPEAVPGLTVSKDLDGENLTLNWDDVPAIDFVVFEDDAPTGAFTEETGTAATGLDGLTTPIPIGRRFYLVAARNGCGLGPKR